MNRKILEGIKSDLKEAKIQVEAVNELLLTAGIYDHNCLGLWCENEKVLNKIYDKLVLNTKDDIEIFDFLELDNHYDVPVNGIFIVEKNKLIKHFIDWLLKIEECLNKH